jgi:acyl dehydratase
MGSDLMALDYARLKAMPPVPVRHGWKARDTILYALGVGASELPFVYEDGLQALPTMAGVLAYPGFLWRNPDYGLAWQKILHAEQSIEIHAPLPVAGEFSAETTIDAIVDKGADKGALIYSSPRIHDGGGRHVATARQAIMARGDGGFGGGDVVASLPAAPDDRPADHGVTLTTAENQALIYRLSGDLNPLHVDPQVAQAGGFARPILHGMCTYGVAGRALIAALMANDPTRLTALRCRFSAPVYPGETIHTEIWLDGPGRARFRSKVVERDLVVLSHGVTEFRQG